MKVLLIDDHQLFRSGMRTILAELQGDIEFFEADHCDAALQYENQENVDLVLLDLYLPGTDGFEALDRIKQCFHCGIVVLSSEDDPHVIREAIARGAAGFIPKSSSPEVLIAALRLVLADGIYLPPHVLDGYPPDRPISASQAARRDAVISELTERQLDVLIKAAQGKTNKIIARELHIAEGTVKAHLSACYRVLNVSNRVEAVYATASIGLVSESRGGA